MSSQSHTYYLKGKPNEQRNILITQGEIQRNGDIVVKRGWYYRFCISEKESSNR